MKLTSQRSHVANVAGLIKIKRKLLLALQPAKSDQDSAAGQSLLAGELSDSSGGGPGSNKGASRVPKGYLAVYVGPDLRRFVIPIGFLRMPDFVVLMERMADEFGCQNHGALQIPCDEKDFEQILATCYRISSSK